jgi:Glycine-zipper domain
MRTIMQPILQKKFCLLTFVAGLCLLILLVGCGKKSETTTETPAGGAQPGTPAAPSKPVPSFSAAQKAGVYVSPSKNQAHDQQLIDESECYDIAQQQSGVNPEMAPPQPPTSAEIQAAQEQGAASAPQKKGGRAKGAAKGAVGGAVIGGVAGDAGKGAAIGATAGVVVGGHRQRKANNATKEQGASQAGSQVQQQYEQQKAAYDQQMGNFKRAFSGCLNSRGYTAK